MTNTVSHITKRKRRVRMIMVAGLICFTATSAGLVALAFRDNIVFFYGPGELLATNKAHTSTIRIGGLVKADSVSMGADQATIQFVITDNDADIPVQFLGVLPDLFREGQGIVALGTYDLATGFRAQEVLAKHDENYMPAEVVAALKTAGTWQQQ